TGLKARELAGLHEMVGHRLGVLALVGWHIPQGSLELLPVQKAAAEDRLEQRIDGARLSTLGHPWLRHTRISKRLATGSRVVECAAADPDGRRFTQPVSASFIGPGRRKV